MMDDDPIETQEWQEALASVIAVEGAERARFILQQLFQQAQHAGIDIPSGIHSAYQNTISTCDEPDYPGNIEIEERLSDFLRWNAMAMVVRAAHREPNLGGHIASYASALHLYEVGFHHFFKSPNSQQGGDMVYIQGHSSPGIYARAFLEGRLTEAQLDHFREEVEVDGLSSYPHPWLMPDFWRFPTVSMGLGPLQAIYQARFLKYLSNRKLLNTDDRNVFAFCGDGEMDEPESLGAIRIASDHNLDNLVFVVNCNLQRLDGPVRGNGKIVQDLEGVFRGAGWNVVKVLWDENWMALIERDQSGLLKRLMEETVDGEYQNLKGKPGAYGREYFFGKYPELLKLVEHLSDEELEQLNFGGHDWKKVYAAYHQAVNHKGQPTVILAKTIKGFGMGLVGQGQNVAHNTKKLNIEAVKGYRDRFDIPVSDAQLADVPYAKLPEDSAEIQYLKKQREHLGGFLPVRPAFSQTLDIPALDVFATHLKGTGEREISTTMAFVRILNTLLKQKAIKERIVPIIPDECRTFGMEGLFRQIGIYSAKGQLYKPVDAEQLMYYREDKKGQVLEEGITEAGGFCSWLAAATSYNTNNFPMIPFFIYYSMFGFQRIADLAWAAGDSRARGFLLGGTAGRTTLAGEGLQHQDGQSHSYASFIPNCRSYDPTYSYELAVIIQDGLHRMYQQQEDCYYYITVMNENYSHPDMPEGAEDGIVKGMYLLRESTVKTDKALQMLGSGTILREVLKASDILQNDYQISADVWSVTSFNELARDGSAVERWNRLHPTEQAKSCYVSDCLMQRPGSVIAATDYIRAYSDQVRAYIAKPYTALGTDGYGRSDTREKLRHFFEVDAKFVVVASLKMLAEQGDIQQHIVSEAINKFGIDPDKPNPTTV